MKNDATRSRSGRGNGGARGSGTGSGGGKSGGGNLFMRGLRAGSSVLKRFSKLKLKAFSRAEKKIGDATVKSLGVQSSVSLSEQTGEFEAHNLPDEWREALKETFGLPPQLCTCVEVPGYASPIPTVLQEMKEYLRFNRGYEAEGIFRKAPNKVEFERIKEQIRKGTFKACKDIHCISNLIKVWFRELPKKILNEAPYGEIQQMSDSKGSEARAIKLMGKFKEPYKSLLFWLIDTCVEVIKRKAQNRMSAQALAIVIAPNLYKTPVFMAGDVHSSLEAMKKTKQYTLFWCLLVKWRARERAEGKVLLVDDAEGDGSMGRPPSDLPPELPPGAPPRGGPPVAPPAYPSVPPPLGKPALRKKRQGEVVTLRPAPPTLPTSLPPTARARVSTSSRPAPPTAEEFKKQPPPPSSVPPSSAEPARPTPRKSRRTSSSGAPIPPLPPRNRKSSARLSRGSFSGVLPAADAPSGPPPKGLVPGLPGDEPPSPPIGGAAPGELVVDGLGAPPELPPPGARGPPPDADLGEAPSVPPDDLPPGPPPGVGSSTPQVLDLF